MGGEKNCTKFSWYLNKLWHMHLLVGGHTEKYRESRDRQADWQADRQADRLKNRQTDWQTEVGGRKLERAGGSERGGERKT